MTEPALLPTRPGLVAMLLLAGLVSPTLGLASPRDLPGIVQFAATIAWSQSSSEQETRAELDRLLVEPEFRRLRSLSDLTPDVPSGPQLSWNWLQRLSDWLGTLMNGTNTGGGTGFPFAEITKIVGALLVGLLFAAAIWLIVKAVNAYRWRERTRLASLPNFDEQTLELPPGDIPADEFRRRSEELARQGLFGEAVAQLLLGAMSQMERGELIRFRRGLTYRDYLRALRSHPEKQHDFRDMVSIYLPIGFGRQPALESHHREVVDLYSRSFAQPLMTAVPAATSVEAGVSS